MVETNHKRTTELTGREERLLARLHDGECGLVARFRAERLVKRRAAARDFLAALDEAKRLLVERSTGTEKGDLWSGIAARIAQEERAELFLGKRRETVVQKFVALVREHRQVAWGIPSGAALAGLILFFVAPHPGLENGPENVAPFGVAKSGTTQVPVVNLASAGGGVRSRHPVEVDWVRGNGRVRVMQDPQRNSAIIWVRRPQAPKFLPGERFVAPTPDSVDIQRSSGGRYPR